MQWWTSTEKMGYSMEGNIGKKIAVEETKDDYIKILLEINHSFFNYRVKNGKNTMQNTSSNVIDIVRTPNESS